SGSSSGEFDFNQYLKYLNDLSLPILPWETETDLLSIAQKIKNECTKLSQELNLANKYETQLDKLDELPIGQRVKKLRELKNDLMILKLRGYSYNREKLSESIEGIGYALSGEKILTTRPSLDLEWFVSLSLMVLNDAANITPSYKLGDDGLPTGFASNKADIKCDYSNFGMIAEVTLMMGRDQWFAECQPVMRHLRDYEDSSKSDDNYCIFIAPYIHKDTLNTFWNSIKYGYEGRTQKIIPITINQYMKILQGVDRALVLGKKTNCFDYKNLFESIFSISEKSDNSIEWLESMEEQIAGWVKKITT
ncbi:MAG: AlwI family type II restriction endonuclease, partial [Bacteroidales bacterium]|nr:AlwI family type II restriction endonuclease [Bacteroidales bacterium]